MTRNPSLSSRAALACVVLVAGAAHAAGKPAAGKPAPAAAAAPAKSAPETKGPLIDHTPVQKVFTGQVTTLRAKMVDPDGIFEPKVFVRGVGKKGFTPFSFEKADGDEFKAEIPPGMSAGGAFQYYIEAFDSAGNGPSRVGTPAKPIDVFALPPPPVPVHVLVRTEPEGAEVTIDGEPAGQAPVKKELMPGQHVILVRASGRRAMEQRVELVSGRDLDAFVALRSEGGEGKLRVTSTPPGAGLSVDLTPAGETPFEIKGLKGTRVLRVELPGYVPEERVVTLEEGKDAEIAFALRAMPDDPALAIESTPAGAKVLIDGKERGTTPWIGVVGAGEHELVLKGDDGRELASPFAMPEKNDLHMRFTLPEPRADGGAGLLAIVSEPPGANLSIAGAAVGRTPFLGPLPQGEAEILLSLDGYNDLRRKLLFDGKRDRELSFTLDRTPGPGKVFLTARPANAVLILDGLEVGKGPAQLQVDPGEHEVSAKLQGRKTVAQRVVVASGQKLAVTLDLPAADTASTAPAILVESKPGGATLKIDGKDMGKTPSKRLVLAVGKHDLELTLNGYETYKASVTIPDQPSYELRVATNLNPVRALQERPVASLREVVDAQLERGVTCFSTKDWACGADAFKRAYDLEPDADYMFQVAVAYSAEEKWADAAKSARTAADKATKEKLRKDALALATRCDERASGKNVAAPDTTPPVIEHEPLDIAYRERPARVVATLRDESGVFLPRVCWRNLLADTFACGEMKPTAGDKWALDVPGASVRQGFAYFIEAFDMNGNGPSRSGSPESPWAVSIEDPPAGFGALQGVSSGPEYDASANTPALIGFGTGAALGVGALVAGLVAYAAVSSDTVTAEGVHTITQAQATSARTKQSLAIGLAAAAAVGIGVGVLLLPPADDLGGGDGWTGSVSVSGKF